MGVWHLEFWHLSLCDPELGCEMQNWKVLRGTMTFTTSK